MCAMNRSIKFRDFNFRDFDLPVNRSQHFLERETVQIFY